MTTFMVAWLNVVFSWTVGSVCGVVLLKRFINSEQFSQYKILKYTGAMAAFTVYAYLFYVSPVIILIVNHYMR